MRWEIVGRSFAIDGTEADGPSISLRALWHVPTAYQFTAYPNFEVDEEERLFQKNLSVHLKQGNPDDTRQYLLESWRVSGEAQVTDKVFDGVVETSGSEVNFTFGLPRVQIASLQRNLLASIGRETPAFFKVLISCHLIVGSLGMAVQPKLKEKFMTEGFSVGVVGRPRISILFGEPIPSAPSLSDLRKLNE